jgi:hypothetical protein
MLWTSADAYGTVSNGSDIDEMNPPPPPLGVFELWLRFPTEEAEKNLSIACTN